MENRRSRFSKNPSVSPPHHVRSKTSEKTCFSQARGAGAVLLRNARRVVPSFGDALRVARCSSQARFRRESSARKPGDDGLQHRTRFGVEDEPRKTVEARLLAVEDDERRAVMARQHGQARGWEDLQR